MTRPTIGIIGGMGPRAGVELARLVVEFADVSSDQEHPNVLLVSRPALVVDRSEYLAGRTRESPSQGILMIARELATSGATVLGIACNTSHAEKILRPVVEGLRQSHPACQIVSIIEAAVSAARRYGGTAPIGILGTEGTFSARVYEDMFEESGESVLWPSAETRVAVHSAIYDRDKGIKSFASPVSDWANQIISSAARELQFNGAGVIILGCTELPLALDAVRSINIPVVDPMCELARAMLETVGIPVRKI